MGTVDLGSGLQDIFGERSASLLQERHHTVALPLGPPNEDQIERGCGDTRPLLRSRRLFLDSGQHSMATDIKPIRSDANHAAALAEVELLWAAKSGTPKATALRSWQP